MKEEKVASIAPGESEEIIEVKTKGVSILFDENGVPSFVFSGVWKIGDVSIIKRMLGRQYRQYQKETRIQNSKEETK